ncbi:alpha/beta hydrolase [Actinocrispum wychmicini]|uniref:Alpha/beta hydrolase family protein n=1 Tax=Actinocrispum wychmicini TaxID=1213861 RepID=A0A4R2JTI3_9PSEU|nr:alpha/beta hydrolase [Actinocrispum wychmicini]TCO62447.1 alpha/beta hydrolase family protein [Actinocrispum wychmicini]
MRVVVGAALVACALVLGTGVASAQTETPSLTWKPCQENATYDCATLSLPIDWTRPSGEKFPLAVNRLKAGDPAHRLGVLLVNPGGPGGSGVDFAFAASRFFSPDILAHFDIIGFDPRGVARSQPVKCSLSKLENAPSLYPTNQAEFTALAKYNHDLRADCRAQSGAIVDHVDTGAVVQDVDSLRKALGEKQINYHGVSYGTLIGQLYAERFGSHIRSMVIDSNMDHSLGTIGFAATEAWTMEDSFTEFVKWCDRTASCALHGKDVAKVWDGLLAKADKGQVHAPGDPSVKLPAEQVVGVAGSAFYGPAWSQLASLIAELDAQQPVANLTNAAAEATVPNPFQAVFCQDYSLPIRNFAEYSVVRGIETGLAPHMRGGSLGHTASVGCVGWTDQAANPQHRLDIRNAPKILMLNSKHDPATAYPWALNAHQQTRDTTVLVTYDGWGHGVYPHTDCTRAAVNNYLISRTVPNDGTHCAAQEPPAVTATAAAPTLPKTLPMWDMLL